MPAKIIAAATFLVAYVLLIQHKIHPPVAVWTGTALLLGLRVITPLQALQSINLNVLGIFVGTMILSDFFIHSQVPAYLTSVLVNPKRSIAGAVLAVCILSGAISAVVDNVATVLMIAPIALEVSRQLCISPVPFMIGISVSANLQGAGTMVGDSTSILMASTANMTFTDFFWMNGRPGIFFSVQLAAVASFIVLYLVFRAYKGKCVAAKRIRVTSWVPTVLMVLMMVTMAVSSFLPNRPDWGVGAIALAYAGIGIVWNGIVRYKETIWYATLTGPPCCSCQVVRYRQPHDHGPRQRYRDTDLDLDQGARSSRTTSLWMSVLLSAFVDNIRTPWRCFRGSIGRIQYRTSPYVMMFGLLLGTTLGGNITPIGASANVVAVSLLRKNGHEVSFGDFVRIGLPFTVSAVLVGSLLNWAIWR